ncbi:MAG: D-glycerate dehydrogenase [Candidatus Taylorbacteria bacterium]
MTKKIFITRRIPEIGINRLKDRGYEVDIGKWIDPPTSKEIIKYLKYKPYDAVVTLPTDPINRDVFDVAPQAKIFANYAVGFDNIDLTEAKARGIMVTNAAGSSSYPVAEHAMALIFALSTRIVEGDRFMREGKFRGWRPELFIGEDVHGKTLGIVGTGKIGEIVASMAHKGFGMDILYYDIKRNEAIERNDSAQFVPTVEEILKRSDVVTLHVPLNDSTRHLINENHLKMMKPTALLVNTSRGGVVDEVALVRALKDKVIRGAGLDVFEFEPKLARGLSKLQNVILTPHIASARQSARDAMAISVAENIVSFFETGKALNPVY